MGQAQSDEAASVAASDDQSRGGPSASPSSGAAATMDSLIAGVCSFPFSFSFFLGWGQRVTPVLARNNTLIHPHFLLHSVVLVDGTCRVFCYRNWVDEFVDFLNIYLRCSPVSREGFVYFGVFGRGQ